MKEKAKQRETWGIVASIIVYLATAAATIYGGVAGDKLPIEAVVPLFTAALAGLGVGSATQVKRAAQRGEALGKAAAPVITQAQNDYEHWGGATFETQQAPTRPTRYSAATAAPPPPQVITEGEASSPHPATGPRAEQQGDD